MAAEKKAGRSADDPPDLIQRIFGYLILFVIAAYLIRTACRYLAESWPVLTIIAIIILAAAIGWRVWKNRHDGRW